MKLRYEKLEKIKTGRMRRQSTDFSKPKQSGGRECAFRLQRPGEHMNQEKWDVGAVVYTSLFWYSRVDGGRGRIVREKGGTPVLLSSLPLGR